MLVLFVGAMVAGSASGAAIDFSFDGVVGTTVTNLGTWGSSHDGNLVAGNYTLDVVGNLDGAAYGKTGQWAPLGTVLHSTTAGGTAAAYDGNDAEAIKTAVSLYTAEPNTDQTGCLSFWIKPGPNVNANDIMGNAGGQFKVYFVTGEPQTHSYITPDGSHNQETWFVDPNAGWGGDRLTPFTYDWDYYTLQFGSSTNTQLYKNGVFIGEEPGNASWSSNFDGLGFRVGGHNGGNDILVDNLSWSPGTTTTEAAETARWDAQWVPEPATLAVLGLGGIATLLRRRKRVDK